MACNCGGASNQSKQVHIYTDEKGKQTSYQSLVQAQAARVRNKGLGSVRTESK
jgi:hypothetical protein